MKETITIIHTNDLHGNYDLLQRQAAVIKKRVLELQAKGENYILVDGGDHLDMSINECLATSGDMNLEMLADVGYHAMSVGNNELLRSSPELIRQLSLESKVPWLLLNLEEADGSCIGGTKETLLMNVGEKLKVGLFGATAQYGVYESKHRFRNRNTLDFIKKAVNELKEKGANLIVFLSHMGYDNDIELAEQLNGLVDVIVGAHTHTVLEQPVEKAGVIIVQAGSHGKYVGELKLEIDLSEGRIVEFEGALTEISMDSDCDPSMSAILEKGRQQTKKVFSEYITYTDESISHEDIVKIMAESLQAYWGADIGVMYGGAAVGGLEKGEITKGTVFDLCKSMHAPVLIEMKGEQIEGLIQESLKKEIINRKVYGNGFRPHGIPIGALQFSNVTWTEQPGLITDIKVNGEALDKNRSYTLGSGTPLLYAEVCGYSSVAGSIMKDIDKFVMIKDVLLNYLKKRDEALYRVV
jgi:5'-nucleotidase